MENTVKQLVVLAGPDKGKSFPLHPGEPMSIGRGGDTLTRLNDLRVSRNHCRIRIENDRVLIADANSALGTFVNDQKISEQELMPGDKIRIGETEMQYRAEAIAEAATLAGDRLADIVGGGLPLADLAGSTLAHFAIVDELARGRSSVVFRARDNQTNNSVALKVYLLDIAKTDADLQRLMRAHEPILKLRHPHLVSVYEVGKSNGRCWIAMEPVDGDNLAQLIERAGPMGMVDWQFALRIGIHMAKALDYLHQNRVIHRNITPKTILVNSSDKRTKLAGLARAKILDRSIVEIPTRTEDLLRDAVFMPPERLRDETHADPRSDFFSLGTALYALISGHPPFGGKSPVDIIANIIQNQPERLREYQLSIPDSFEQVILKMLAKRPEQRQATASELLTDLERVSAHPVSASHELPPAPPPPLQQAPVPPPPPALEQPVRPASSPQTPEPPVEDGFITITCKCGQLLKAREKFAGTRVRCPKCNHFLRLPGQAPAEQPSSFTMRPSDMPPPAPPETSSGSLIRVLIGIIILGVVAAGAYFGGLINKKETPKDDSAPEKKSAPADKDKKDDAKPAAIDKKAADK